MLSLFAKSRIIISCILVLSAIGTASAQRAAIAFEEDASSVRITIDGEPFATYVYRDDAIPRPYFCHMRAPGGIQVTRNHPPHEETDPTDHAGYHPGLWLSFGDISEADFWRNRARTEHVRYVQSPENSRGSGGFTVENRYVAGEGGQVVCREVCRYTIHVRPAGYLLIGDSEFSSDRKDFYFGDQEEMGFGVRVASPIMVKNGGRILNSNGLKNEKDVWGKQADWCDYSGVIDGRYAGVTLMPSPDNFRRSWFHARDYGLLLANPFGRNAFTEGKKSRIVVLEGDSLRIRYGILLHCAETETDIDLSAAYEDFVKIDSEL